MSVRRVVPDLTAADAHDGQAFFTEVIGLRVAMDLGWIVTYASPSNPTAQINVMQAQPDVLLPDYSVEVGDVDLVHERAVSAGVEIVYALRTEPWGVRRFFVRDPLGRIANILSHAG
jgi:catechol 2,3-dioxygenase-like lactoylglutathione lyase family enzyme